MFTFGTGFLRKMLPMFTFGTGFFEKNVTNVFMTYLGLSDFDKYLGNIFHEN